MVGRLLAVQNICSLEMFECPNEMYCYGGLSCISKKLQVNKGIFFCLYDLFFWD